MPVIAFNQQVDAEGRNGYFQASAIDIHKLFDNEVWLQNLTSRGLHARGHATLPADPDILRQAAATLNRIADTL